VSYGLALLATVLEHELDSLTHHRSCLLESLALRVHLWQLAYMDVHPAFTRVLTYGAKGKRHVRHGSASRPWSDGSKPRRLEWTSLAGSWIAEQSRDRLPAAP
jgi:hypothetical protein